MHPSIRRGYPPSYRLGNAPAQQPAQQQPPPAPEYNEEEHILNFQATLTANQSIRDTGRDVDKEGDWWLNSFWGSSTGAYNILIRFPNGRSLTSSPVKASNLIGTAQFRVGVKPIYFPAGSRISLDLEDTSGAENDIEILFGGIRRIYSRS